MKKFKHLMLAVSLASMLAAPSYSMAQQPAPVSAATSGTTGPVIASEAEHKGTILTFQTDIQVARHQYYMWRGNCYFRKPSGDFTPVAPGYCS